MTGLNWGATSSDQNATTIKDIQNLNIHLRSQDHDATNPNAIHQTVGIGGYANIHTDAKGMKYNAKGMKYNAKGTFAF